MSLTKAQMYEIETNQKRITLLLYGWGLGSNLKPIVYTIGHAPPLKQEQHVN